MSHYEALRAMCEIGSLDVPAVRIFHASIERRWKVNIVRTCKVSRKGDVKMNATDAVGSLGATALVGRIQKMQRNWR